MPRAHPALAVAAAIRERAARIGLERVGFCDAGVPAEASIFQSWLASGMHAEMGWLERGRSKRLDPSLVLPGARSFVVAALAMACRRDPPAGGGIASASSRESEGPPGLVARYARGDDYHRVMGDRLREIEELIEREAPGERALAYVDTGPFLERLWAARAGIGWVGKNSLVLNKEMGSHLVLGLVVTTLHLPPDEPALDQCGTCSLCIEACPTGAIVAPKVVDSRRCISYHTIELRGSIPEGYRAAIGDRVFGCDDCQDACPWNRAEDPGASEGSGVPGADPSLIPLLAVLSMTHDEYLARFRDSAVRRATWRGLRRNAALGLGNAAVAMTGRDPERAGAIATELERMAGSELEDPLMRDQAGWSAARIRQGLRETCREE